MRGRGEDVLRNGESPRNRTSAIFDSLSVFGPIDATVSGTSIRAIPVFLIIPSEIDAMLAPIVISLRFVQSRKQSLPMLSTDAGRCIEVCWAHPAKANWPTKVSVVFDSNMTLVIAFPWYV